jgi:hypothetical protein
MVVASNRFRWVAALACVGTLWLAAAQTRGGEPGNLAPISQSAAPTTPPLAAAEQAVPATQAFWSTSNDEGSDFPDPIGRYRTDTLWFRADYLLWWTTAARLPPLVTTSLPGTALADAGVLGSPDTTVLFGGQVGGDARSGFRTILGVWLDNYQLWDLAFDYLSLCGRSDRFSETSDGDPILARPFFDVRTNQQSALILAYPGVATGTVTAEAGNDFQSFGLSVSHCLCDRCACAPLDSGSPPSKPPLVSSFRLDLLGAFRYYGLNDSVTVWENLVIANYLGFHNVNVAALDVFRARNDFYGGELGLRTRMYRGRWSLDVLGKVALGGTHRAVNIAGSAAITPPGRPTTLLGFGALATSSDIGVYTQDAFTAIPTLGIELGYRWNGHWRTHIGYDLIYWSDVARAGEQIDLNLDRSGAGQSPLFPGRRANFLAQGLNVGAEFRF